jgi:hypothetical protein
MKKILLMGLLLGILATVAATGTMSAVYSAPDDDKGHDYTKHNDNPGQSKDGEQKNHGCEKGSDSQGWVSSDGNCYHPG